MPRVPTFVLIALVVGLGAPCVAAAEDATLARRIAVGMISERARLLGNVGDAVAARMLDDIAAALRDGKLALGEAIQLVQLHQALPAAERRLPAAPSAQDLTGGVPPAGAGKLTDILDGEPASAVAKPSAPAAGATAGQATTPASGGQPSAPASAAPQPAAAATAPPAEADQVGATVLAVHAGADQRPALVMIDVGLLKGTAAKQRFAVRRGVKTQVQLEVVELRNKGSMAVCRVLTDTWIDDKAEIREGDEAVRLP